MPILKIQDLNKSYKRGFIPKVYPVLKNVSFELPARTITGFLGGNGAGKTTTIKCLLDLAYPDSGEITFFGGKKISSEVKRKIGFLPERPYFYEYLTGEEFLFFYGELSTKLKKKSLHERILKLLKRVDLLHAKDKKLREYSKGMLQKIGVAQALIHEPEFIILDEPMSGLDPDGRFYIADIIRETAKEGRCVFFSSHLLNDAESICERLVILKGGQVSYQGPLSGFLEKMGDAAIIEYLKNGHRELERVNSEADLQKRLGELLQSGAQIETVKRDRNLEQAFIKMGLRGD
jgi:ABC-2 type transport system ATP-binding protein